MSTEDQHIDLQLDALNKYGVDKIFHEKMTGTRIDRPQMEEMRKILRAGDKVIVYKLDRISRSTKHLIELGEHFNESGIDFVSLKDQIDTSTAMGKFFFRTMASIAELERDIISERTKPRLEAARARGRQGGRPAKKKEKVEFALKMYNSKEYSVEQFVEASGLSKTTLYRYINQKSKL